MLWFLKSPLSSLRVICVVVLSLFISGCGYTLSHRLKDTFAGAKNGIFVPVFINYTDEVGAEVVFTNALIRELQSRGEILIKSKKQSALELRGDIEQLHSGPTAHTGPGFDGLQSYRRLPSEIAVNAVLKFQLIDIRSGRVMWEKRFLGTRKVNASTSRTYNYEAPSSFGIITQSVIASVFPDIARDIMRDVYDEMVEIF